MNSNVPRFWFPPQLRDEHAAMVRQFQWWFGGGSDLAVAERSAVLLERAIRGELDHWSHAPRPRLALIIVLDQFSRSIYRGTARAFAQDRKAVALAPQGIVLGHYAALATLGEKTFFLMPLGHAENSRTSTWQSAALCIRVRCPTEFNYLFAPR